MVPLFATTGSSYHTDKSNVALKEGADEEMCGEFLEPTRRKKIKLLDIKRSTRVFSQPHLHIHTAPT